MSVCKGLISKSDLCLAPSYLPSMPNFCEAFYWRKSLAQGAKERCRAQRIGVGRKTVYKIDPRLQKNQTIYLVKEMRLGEAKAR